MTSVIILLTLPNARAVRTLSAKNRSPVRLPHKSDRPYNPRSHHTGFAGLAFIDSGGHTPRAEEDFRHARKAHTAFLVEDLAALTKPIQAAGYTTRVDEPLDGYGRIYVDDPFGNRIKLLEPIAGKTA